MSLRRFLVLAALAAGMVFHSGTAEAQRDQASIVQSFADVTLSTTAQVVDSANANRRTLSCTNNHASIAFRWGDSAITTTRGQRVAAGATVSITGTYAIYMIAESGAPTVSCTREVF